MTRRVPDPVGPPRVSVLLVVHEAERFVGEAVDSILTQRFGDFELLIYDDGSTDDACDVLERAAGRDLRVQLFREEPGGPVQRLRRGVEDACGEFVALMEPNAVAHPDRLAQQLAFLQRHPDCLAVGCDLLLVDPLRRPIRRLGVPTQHEDILAQLKRGLGDAMPHGSAMLRRAEVLSVGGYVAAGRTAPGLDLLRRLGERGCLANLPVPLLESRQQLGSEHESAPDAWHRWACWALDAGHLATARRYAWRVFRREPFSRRSCLLGLQALLGVPLEAGRARLSDSRVSARFL